MPNIIRPLYKKWENEDFEIQGWSLHSDITEELRPERLVTVGLIQHKIVLPTTKPILSQQEAIHKKIASYIKEAADHDVQILCLQEAWSMWKP